MSVSKMQVVTIIADPSLESALCAALQEWGAPYYSIFESYSPMARERLSSHNHDRRVRIEVIVSDQVAESIIIGLESEFRQEESIVCFQSTVNAATINRQDPFSANNKELLKSIPWAESLISI